MGEQRSSQLYRKTRQFKSAATVLGRRVRELRTARGWTLEHAAERMQLDLKHLQKVEAGQINVTLVTLARIATGLSESISTLFERAARR